MKTINVSETPLTLKPVRDTDGPLHALSRRCGLRWPTKVAIDERTHVTHAGLLDYLALAYRHHYSVVIRPDDIWFMVLCELTSIISKKPEHYASLFTTTPGQKQEIIVPTLDPTAISPGLVYDSLKHCLPTDADAFLPTFSTTTTNTRTAMYVAFCDLVSPYYRYGTLLCGIPAIRFEGTDEDWTKLCQSLQTLEEIFRPMGSGYLVRCHHCARLLAMSIKNEAAGVFRDMVKLEPCGSGSQYEMTGWILDFILANKKTQLEGLPPHLACMSYKNLDTQRRFKMFTGLTESRLEDGFLVPQYGRYVVEQLKDSEREPTLEEMRMSSERIKVYYPVGHPQHEAQ